MRERRNKRDTKLILAIICLMILSMIIGYSLHWLWSKLGESNEITLSKLGRVEAEYGRVSLRRELIFTEEPIETVTATPEPSSTPVPTATPKPNQTVTPVSTATPTVNANLKL